MKLVRGSELHSELITLCIQSERVSLAVAFWGDGAADALGLTKFPEKVSIICNLRMGGTNPREIRKLRDLAVRVRHSDTLHAKIYLFDNHAIVGSSNVSTNGLSLQGPEIGGWTEANVQFEAGQIYQETMSLFDEIWAEAQEVTESDLAIAQATWDQRRRGIGAGLKLSAPNIFEALKSEPKSLSDRGVYVTVDFFDMSPAAKKVVARVQKETGLGDATDAWEGWPTMPDGAHFICFSRETNGIEFGGFWRSPQYRREVKVGAGSIVCFVDRTSSIYGLKKIGAIAEWRKVISRAIEARGSHGLICIEAGEFAREFMGSPAGEA